MKNQYWNYRAVLLKSKACFVANLMEETDLQRDTHTFIIAQVCVRGGKAKERDWVLSECSWGAWRRFRWLQFRVKSHFQFYVWASQVAHCKELLVSAGDAGLMGLILVVGGSSRGGRGNPFQYSCRKTSHEQRSLTDYSPGGHKETDMTE